MINPMSGSIASQANEALQSSVSKPQTNQAQQQTARPSDTVTLKSTGDVDSDGDNK
jgi:hypothetical protein